MIALIAAVMMVLSVTAYADSYGGNVGSGGIGGYTGGGVNGGVNVSGTGTPVYQFYSSFMNDYFLTASETEKASLERDYMNGTQTYQYIGVFGYAEAYSTGSNVPVYRFWNQKTTDHFYTISEAEKIQTEENYRLGTDDYKYEGIAFYVPSYGYTPVYRFYDTMLFSHRYIIDETVKNQLITDAQTNRGYCRYEGVAWYW